MLLSKCCKSLVFASKRTLPNFFNFLSLLTDLLPLVYICRRCDKKCKLVKGNEYKTPHYIIEESEENGLSITHTFCNMTSHHPNDISQKYCANCNRFLDDLDYYLLSHNPELYTFYFNLTHDGTTLKKSLNKFTASWVNGDYTTCRESLRNAQAAIKLMINTYAEFEKTFNLRGKSKDGKS